MRRADLALYAGKESGKNQVVTFHEQMHNRMVQRAGARVALQQALEQREFTLFYQPIVSLETGAIVSFEALLRWIHPERGMVSPLEFIPLAEETGLIVPIGTWVIGEAFAQLAAWRREFGLHTLGMSVNVSGLQIQQGDVAAIALAAVETNSLTATGIALELTESMLIKDDPVVLETLRQARQLGFKISIDDFGTGYSSLGYLQHFPIDVLKVDRTFVTGLSSMDRRDGAVAKAVIALARGLGMDLVAEGIETVEQWRMLLELGSDCGQGFLFAKPLPAAEAAERLRAGVPLARLEPAQGSPARDLARS
jgi:EAL domain-containing protein (putative c-di-GMP-specific phosphodiesterase class I)